MSKLNDYILNNIFPLVHTGKAFSDECFNRHIRTRENTIYKCSLCDSDILPSESLNILTQSGHVVELKTQEFIGGFHHIKEALGYTCKKCDEEISSLDMLHYG